MSAMLDAGMIRFRPILMTSFSTILGILPIAIGWGAGGESRRPMGVAAVGGLVTSTFLTLLVIPVVYTLFADLTAWLRGHRRARPAAATAVVTGVLALLALSLPARAQAEAPAATPPVATYDLARCMGTALEHNFDLLKARERVRRQYGAVVEVRSRIVPNLAASGQYVETENTLANNFPGAGSVSGHTENWNVGLEITQSLYAGGQNRASLQQQNLLEDVARRELESAINEVLLDVREKYYGVLLARSQIRVQEQNIDLLQEELQSARNKLDAGAVSPFNVLRAEVALANGRTPLIRARNNYRLALEDLSRVLGLQAGRGEEPALDVTGDLAFESYDADLARERATALLHRPELKRLATLIEAQQRGLRAAQGGYQPNLSAFAGYGFEKDQASDGTWDSVDGWSAGLRMGWSVFDGMGTRGRTLRAASDLQLARLDEEQARLNIDVDVRRAHSSYVEASELVTATRKVVEQALESVRLARSRFDVGAATQLDVLQTQQALTEARDNEVQALHDYNVALARLRKAMGILDVFAEAPAPKENH